MVRDLQHIEKDWSYYDGNHIDHWIGIKPDINTEEGKKNQDAITRLFQSCNILEKVVDYHTDALIGNDPAIAVEGEGREQLDDTARQLWKRWTSTAVGDEFSTPIAQCLTSAKATGYGYLRLWKPERLLNSPDLLQRVALHSPDPSSVEIVRDENGFIEKIKYYFYEDLVRKVEIQYLNENGFTVFEYAIAATEQIDSIIGINGELQPRTFALNLGGKFTVYELRLKPLINESTRRNQDAINHALTMIPRGNELSGFLARFFSNARPPGRWVTSEDGSSVFEPDPDGLVIGAGIVNFISGLPIRDAQGNVSGYTSVGVHTDPPIPIVSFRDSFELFSAVIHLQCNQGHLLSYSLTLSGRSREELKAEFVTALTKDQAPIENLFSDLLTAAIYLIKPNTGAFNVNVQLRLSLGKPSPEERDRIITTFEKGLMSKETAIALLGYSDDPLAEIEKIKAEKAAAAPETPVTPLIVTNSGNGNGQV